MNGENIITWNWPNFITVGLISLAMLAVLGFGTKLISRSAGG